MICQIFFVLVLSCFGMTNAFSAHPQMLDSIFFIKMLQTKAEGLNNQIKTSPNRISAQIELSRTKYRLRHIKRLVPLQLLTK